MCGNCPHCSHSRVMQAYVAANQDDSDPEGMTQCSFKLAKFLYQYSDKSFHAGTCMVFLTSAVQCKVSGNLTKLWLESARHRPRGVITRSSVLTNVVCGGGRQKLYNFCVRKESRRTSDASRTPVGPGNPGYPAGYTDKY